MIVIGLTGSIGMGKSTVAGQLKQFGAKVCSADAIVHRLLQPGGAAVRPISRLFPGTVRSGVVDRQVLGEIVFSDKAKLKTLERLLHPMVVREEGRFIAREKRKGARIIVLDIPLLFETGGEKRCDMTLVASAPLFLQRQRVLSRPGMTVEKFKHIAEAQLPDRQKRRRADGVIPTGLGKAYSFRRVASIMGTLHA